MTVWCISTWFSTEPRLYFFVPPEVAATSTASEMAMPSEPLFSGSLASKARPYSVRSVGLAKTCAPKVCMIDAAVGLLVVRDLDHVDFQVHAEEVAGHRQRGAPLTGAGLGGHGFRPGGFVVKSLRDGGVRFVAAHRRDGLRS